MIWPFAQGFCTMYVDAYNLFCSWPSVSNSFPSWNRLASLKSGTRRGQAPITDNKLLVGQTYLNRAELGCDMTTALNSQLCIQRNLARRVGWVAGAADFFTPSHTKPPLLPPTLPVGKCYSKGMGKPLNMTSHAVPNWYHKIQAIHGVAMVHGAHSYPKVILILWSSH